ncbi:MAG: glycosyltransferase family 2 protein [Fimbriiglobus sp.]|jgi:glycosyltransferase involved in cell wall biosynthesis|nr:glycosyltransferase family 2 protein [Fimbriiglobus sp.]
MRLLSVVIPVKDERANVRPLVQWLRDALTPACDWEAVFVDDGSTDGTHAELLAVAAIDRRVKVVRLRKNFGQSAALQAGFDHAAGDVIATMDGDLQNDPADLPRMLAKLDEGFDVILGERAARHDRFLLRKVPSWCANWLIRKVLRVPFRDFGCTLRVMRREVVEEMQLYGEMHRFITALAVQQGAAVAQVPVRHHPRTAGVSKYGLGRTVRVVLDLLTVKFLASYSTRPMHLFGGLGLTAMAAGLLSLMVTVGMKWAGGQWMTGNPLLLLSVLLEMLGVQLLSLGLIGEGMTRSNFERHGRRPYLVRETANVGDHREQPAEYQRAA